MYAQEPVSLKMCSLSFCNTLASSPGHTSPRKSAWYPLFVHVRNLPEIANYCVISEIVNYRVISVYNDITFGYESANVFMSWKCSWPEVMFFCQLHA